MVCNNEKLVSGGTNDFLHSCEEFLKSTIFRDGQGPTVIMTPSNLAGPKRGGGKDPRFSVEVRAVRGARAASLFASPMFFIITYINGRELHVIALRLQLTSQKPSDDY